VELKIRRNSAENLIHLIPQVLTAGRLEMAHGALHVGVTEPLLHGAQIDASPQASGCERSAEKAIRQLEVTHRYVKRTFSPR